MGIDVAENHFLKHFSPAVRDDLLRLLHLQTYEHGAYLFHEGAIGDGIYLLLDGQVEIIRKAENLLIPLGVIVPGDFFGEVAVFDGEGRSTSARAHGRVKIARIDRTDVLQALGREPVTLTLRLFGNVLKHLRHSNDLFIQEVLRKEKMYLVGEMANSLMHDLRNPIAGIRLAAELIHARHPDEKTSHWCEVIGMQSDRMVAMAREILEFSRGESSLQIVTTDTVSFLHQIEEIIGTFIRQAGVSLELVPTMARVEMDVLRIIRVVQNLLTNAVEAMEKSPEKKLIVRARVENSFFYLETADTGPGIPEPIQATIFEPFVSQGKSNGIGLGMAIVRSIVTAHGGTVTFETSEGKGTTFRVAIPQPVPREPVGL